MGYLTEHTLMWTNEGWTPKRKRNLANALNDEIGHYIASHSAMCWVLTEDGEPYTPICWETCEGDMRAISERFPGVLFHLVGVGEDLGDIWDMFAKDGKLQRHKAVIYREANPRDGEWK